MEHIKHIYFDILGILERDDREGAEDKIAQYFLNLGKKQTYRSRNHRESQTGSNWRYTPMHIRFKMVKIKLRKSIKSAKEKQQVKHKGTPQSLPAHFLAEILLVIRECVSVQLCPTFCNPMDSSLPGSSVHGILQARILEWIAVSFSRGSS